MVFPSTWCFFLFFLVCSLFLLFISETIKPKGVTTVSRLANLSRIALSPSIFLFTPLFLWLGVFFFLFVSFFPLRIFLLFFPFFPPHRAFRSLGSCAARRANINAKANRESQAQGGALGLKRKGNGARDRIGSIDIPARTFRNQVSLMQHFLNATFFFLWIFTNKNCWHVIEKFESLISRGGTNKTVEVF